MKPSFKIRSAAIILMATGYGWAGGHYIPADANIFAYLFQFTVIGFILIMALAYFGAASPSAGKRDRSASTLSILSVVFFTINILNIAHGFYNNGPRSFGSHNTFADLVPVVIILAGSGLWIVTIRRFPKREHQTTNTVNPKK